MQVELRIQLHTCVVDSMNSPDRAPPSALCTAQRHRCDRAINITHCSNHDSVRQHLLQHFAAAAEVLLAERLARLRARVRRKVRMRRGLGD
eukprot:COSAG03_NODE_243_length_10072_cov_11.712925_8_plen_91_part_00